MPPVIVGLQEFWPPALSHSSPIYVLEYLLGDWTRFHDDTQLTTLNLPVAKTLSLPTLGIARLFPKSILENLTLTDQVAAEALRELASPHLQNLFDSRLASKSGPPIVVVAVPDVKPDTVRRLWALQEAFRENLRLVMAAPISCRSGESEREVEQRILALLQVGVSVGTDKWVRAGALFLDDRSRDTAMLELALRVSRKFSPVRVPVIVCGEDGLVGSEGDNIIRMPVPGDGPSADVLSSGLFYKSDRTSWGGEGHVVRVTTLLVRIPASAIEDFVWRRAQKMLSWSWRAPEAEKVEVQMFKCDFCKNRFPCNLDDEPFKKFDWVYCSTKCVNEHRKLCWKAI